MAVQKRTGNTQRPKQGTKGGGTKYLPRVIAWETTLRCNLNCLHCRAGDRTSKKNGRELTTAEGKKLLKNIAMLNRCTVILTGGEPLMRDDIYDLAEYGVGLGLNVALATNGTLLDRPTAERIKASGIARVSLSLDGFSSAVHNDFRGADAAFGAVIKAAYMLREAEMPFQINSSFTRRNVGEMDRLLELVEAIGAVAWHVFFVVPTGKAVGIGSELLDPDEYEDALLQIYRLSRQTSLEIKPTCAPQFYRIIRQKARSEGLEMSTREFGINARTKGCLAGQFFAFVSARGEVMPCGYLPKSAGNVRKNTFAKIWRSSELFKKLRDPDLLKGRCGDCEYRVVCGGCRARAFAESGDFLGAEPLCRYKPE